MCLDPLVFCMRMIYWDSVPNHNRQIIASNASIHIHSPFLLVGCYTPRWTQNLFCGCAFCKHF